ncbi:MAG: hypothetical protein ACRD0G_16825, partial [Acidimicrobiales bacterium]
MLVGVDADESRHAPLQELLAAPFDEFVAARKELAKRLKADGDNEAAAWVTGVRKPARLVWALDQLAREQGDNLERYVRAAASLQTAQRAGDGEGIRNATHGLRDAAGRLAQAVAERLERPAVE